MNKYLENGRRIGLILLACTPLIYGAGKGANALDRVTRQKQIDSYYESAQEVRKAYIEGNLNEAREKQEILWDTINQERRDRKNDFFGRLTDEDVSTLELSFNKAILLSNKPLVKPKL